MVTNEEQTKLVQKESKRLWKSRGFKWIIIVTIILLAGIVFSHVRYQARLIICRINLEYGIGSSMNIYMSDYDDQLPLPGKWNDLLIEYYDVSESVFQCPGSQSEGKMSDYSINKHLYEVGLWKGDCVGLFESKPGWNQIGDVEIFTTCNHRNNGGCYNKSSFSGVQFVEQENVNGIKWKPEE